MSYYTKWVNTFWTDCRYRLPGSNDPFYIVTYDTKWVTASWSDCMLYLFEIYLTFYFRFLFTQLLSVISKDESKRDGLLVEGMVF